MGSDQGSGLGGDAPFVTYQGQFSSSDCAFSAIPEPEVRLRA